MIECGHFLFIFFSFYRITTIGKLFEGKTDLVEEWYGTEYSTNKISPKYIEVHVLRKCTLTLISQGSPCTEGRQTGGVYSQGLVADTGQTSLEHVTHEGTLHVGDFVKCSVYARDCHLLPKSRDIAFCDFETLIDFYDGRKLFHQQCSFGNKCHFHANIL